MCSRSADGIWAFNLKVKSGDTVSYKVTAYYEEDTIKTEWIKRTYEDFFYTATAPFLVDCISKIK